MAEAILRHVAGDRFEALSAGSHPAGFIYPLAAAAMQHLGIPMDGQESKSWDEFADREVNVVITLCDEAAKETCPVWPQNPLTAHWSLPDPAFQPGTEEERLEFAIHIAERLRVKIEVLVALDWSRDRAEIAERLASLAEG